MSTVAVKPASGRMPLCPWARSAARSSPAALSTPSALLSRTSTIGKPPSWRRPPSSVRGRSENAAALANTFGARSVTTMSPRTPAGPALAITGPNVRGLTWPAVVTYRMTAPFTVASPNGRAVSAGAPYMSTTGPVTAAAGSLPPSSRASRPKAQCPCAPRPSTMANEAESSAVRRMGYRWKKVPLSPPGSSPMRRNSSAM